MEQLPGRTMYNDAEVAAYVWLALMYSFMDLLADRTLKIAALDAGKLMDSPDETIAAIETFFDTGPIDRKSLNTSEYTVFTRHSKDTGKIFDKEANRLETKKMAAVLKDEISAGVKWAERVMSGNPVPEILPNHLEIQGKA